MILNDIDIEKLCRPSGTNPPMIHPYVEAQVSKGVLSYGVSSMGYDMRAGYTWEVFTPRGGVILDPKNFDPTQFDTLHCEEDDGFIVLPPNGYAMTYSLEYFNLPSDIIMVVIGKSTYARCGISTNITPGEPGWKGHLTIEVANHSPCPVKLYAGEGIAQALFFRHPRGCRVSYADKNGKYQNQGKAVVPAVVKEKS